MPSNLRISPDAANLEADATCALLDGGYLRIYDGEQPDSPAAAARGQRLLAELRFGTPAFKLALEGRANANPIKPEPSAKIQGQPRWFRCLRADGETGVMDGSVGKGEVDLRLSVDRIVEGMEVHVDGFIYKRPMSK